MTVDRFITASKCLIKTILFISWSIHNSIQVPHKDNFVYFIFFLNVYVICGTITENFYHNFHPITAVIAHSSQDHIWTKIMTSPCWLYGAIYEEFIMGWFIVSIHEKTVWLLAPLMDHKANLGFVSVLLLKFGLTAKSCWQAILNVFWLTLNTSRHDKNGCHFAEDISQMHFLERKSLYFYSNFTDVGSQGSNCRQVSTGPGNGLSPSQATCHYLNQCWPHVWCHKASLFHNELT